MQYKEISFIFNSSSSNKSENTSYNGSVAQAIDNSIASAQTATLDSAKEYADGLASNYDVAGAAATAETNAKDYADSLASNYDAAGAASAAAGAEADRALAAESALDGRLTTAESGVSANAEAIANEKTARENADSAIREEFAAADIDTLNSANSYTDSALGAAKAFANAGDALTLKQANAYTNKKVDTLEKNVSGGVAAATALSAVSVSNVGKGEVSVGGGLGYYNSQSAVAFGAAMGLSDRWSVNAGAGIATGDKTQVSFRAGTNYKFKLF